jgi:hypothetical protein
MLANWPTATEVNADQFANHTKVELKTEDTKEIQLET